MPTIVTRFLDQLLGRSAAVKGILWSLGLHATAFAVSCSWWSGPITDVSFPGNRYVMQLEATLTEMPSEEVIETVLEFDLVQPPEDLAPKVQSPLERQLVVVPPTWPWLDTSCPDDQAREGVAVQAPPTTSPAKEPDETRPVAEIRKPQRRLAEPSLPAALAFRQEFCGVEERTPPDLSANRPPSYPAEAIRSRWEGIVLLRLTISASGKVEQVEVFQSSGYSILDATAVAAVRTWHARPAEQNGTPVASIELLPVHFQL